MNLMHEDMARAHMDARLRQARVLQRGHRLARGARLTRRAERAHQQARLLLDRAAHACSADGGNSLARSTRRTRRRVTARRLNADG